MEDDSGGEEDAEDKGRAEDEVMEAEKGRRLCGFQTGIETGSEQSGGASR